MMKTFRSHSPEETRAIGERMGRTLHPGDVVALIGELGTGKTCLTQGIARGVGIHPGQEVNSPSYTLINEYEGKIPIYHIDLYRLKRLEEIVDLGLEEYFERGGICIIEWVRSDRTSTDGMRDLLPENYLQITMTWDDEFTRTIGIEPHPYTDFSRNLLYSDGNSIPNR